VVYDVAVDEAGLGFEPAGPLFERYTVGLTGRLDRRWVDCYKKITGDSPALSGFRLEPAVPNVSFVCRTSDGPVAVMTVMKKLQELVDRTNRNAQIAAELAMKAEEVESPEAQRATISGLLSRITRSKTT
jgi:hypothetical protein